MIFAITARKRSCGKVMVLHMSVILFTGGWWCVSQHAMGRGCVYPSMQWGVHPLASYWNAFLFVNV